MSYNVPTPAQISRKSELYNSEEHDFISYWYGIGCAILGPVGIEFIETRTPQELVAQIDNYNAACVLVCHITRDDIPEVKEAIRHIYPHHQREIQDFKRVAPVNKATQAIVSKFQW